VFGSIQGVTSRPDPDHDLEGIRAIVSGGTRGLGLAFTRALLERGAAVVAGGTDPVRCEALGGDLGDRAAVVCGDISDTETADHLVVAAVERFGGVDLVVNNAGITRDRTLLKMSEDEWDVVLGVHLRGAWALSRAAAREMPTGGAILNVVSGSALFGLVGQSNYAAAKGGMLGLTRALSVELAPNGIRVNALYPVALTDMTRPVAELAAQRGGGDAIPFGDPAEVAPIVCALASPAAAHVTGQVIHFDGRHLTFWTHPSPAASASRADAWSVADVTAFVSDPAHHEPLHPDRWGAGTRTALKTPSSEAVTTHPYPERS